MIAVGVQRFLLLYAGVFALVALTASVGAGLAAADRVIMSPGGRIAAQAAHRAVSFAAVALLAVHIAVEVVAGRSRPSDAVVPFLDPGRTFYLGLGTIAADLLIVVVVTGLLRGRFASMRTAWLWRAMHALAYLCWLLAIVHGLLAGRTARPYVDWSYGACVAVVALALVFRLAARPRLGETAAGDAGEETVTVPSAAVLPASPLAAPGLTVPGSGAPGYAGPAGAGVTVREWPFAPGPGPHFMPGPGPHFMPGGTGARGRRALPGPGGSAGLTPDHPSYPGAGSRIPIYPGPGYPDQGHPHAGYPGEGYPRESYPGGNYPGENYPGENYPGENYPGENYPGENYPGECCPGECCPGECCPGECCPGERYQRPGHPRPGYPVMDWSGHDEPVQAPCPGDGGR